MSEHPQDTPPTPDVDAPRTSGPAGPAGPAGPDLESLVGDWVTVPDIAERYGIRLAAVRRWIEEGDLVSHRVGERRVVMVPAKFLDDEGPLPTLRGTFTVLSDGGMREEEILHWLFEPDATLPIDGAPIDALLGGFKTEVRRRAMETAF